MINLLFETCVFTNNPNFILFKKRLERRHSPAKCVIRVTEIRRMEIRLNTELMFIFLFIRFWHNWSFILQGPQVFVSDLIKTGACLNFVVWFYLRKDTFFSFFKVKEIILQLSKVYCAGLDKLCAQWWACIHRARKELFACTKLCACKSVKTLLTSTPTLFKVVSYFCLWKQLIFSTIRCDIHNLFYLRSCCWI